jgi:hypothetical protein
MVCVKEGLNDKNIHKIATIANSVRYSCLKSEAFSSSTYQMLAGEMIKLSSHSDPLIKQNAL